MKIYTPVRCTQKDAGFEMFLFFLKKNSGAKRTEIEPTGFCLWHFLGLKSLVLVYVAGLVSNQGFVKFLGSNLCSVCIKGSPLAQCALGNSVVLKSVVESSLSL